MSKQHTLTPKYKVHEFRDTLDIWTSNDTSFICSVPTDPSMDDTAKEKINFVLNILNNHDRLVEALTNALAAQDTAMIRKSREEGIQLLTELKS